MKRFTIMHLKILSILAIFCAFIGCSQQSEPIAERSHDKVIEPISEQPINTKPPLLFNLDDIPFTPVLYKSRVEPVYPDEARQAKKSGEVVIQLIVDENGMPKDIKPLTQLGYGLEASAIESIHNTIFYPATRGNRPVRKEVIIPYRFLYKPAKKNCLPWPAEKIPTMTQMER